jgi:hypothetical protein
LLTEILVYFSIEIYRDGLENLLIWLLQNKTNNKPTFENSIYLSLIERIYDELKLFYVKGENEEKIISDLDSLCKYAYSLGSDRQLLFADIIRSVVKKQIYNSTWKSLYRYSSLDLQKWRDTVLKPTFIREFWPSQRIIGEKNVFRGKSAIIQMPTSAGKTKSTEIIIRSSFLSGRSRMAVIIAPFRALCSEIKNSLQLAFKDELVNINEPSDAIQPDFEFLEGFNFEISKLVLILTPEKFLYILRTSPDLANDIGLLIYDEGHQFDNGIRGVTYELLLSSLKSLVSEKTQIVLISAVISNAESIGNWLIAGEKEIISGLDLSPTTRTIAFASWQTQLGRLQFIKNNEPEEIEYFVPRILEQTSLKLKGRERNKKLFPEKNDGKSVSLYLALKLIENGPLAIFCGSKLTVKSLYEKVIDLESRGYNVKSPLNYSDRKEVNKLVFLHSKHFGPQSTIAKSASLGIFAHSGNTPEGLRLAIEHSMQSGMIRFIVCTSTLAQGVNLPIRYLLITSFYQAGQKIKIRDFHNLIGRAGRSGMHTEGSIIFADVELFDKKRDSNENWKWEQAKKMLNPINSEPCGSTLLSILDPLLSDDKYFIVPINPLDLVKAYLDSPETISKLLDDYAKKYSDKNVTNRGLTKQISYKIQIISSIESYFMAYWDDIKFESNEERINSITKETLAYSISNDNQKIQIIELFKLLAKNVIDKITTKSKRISFGHTLLGVQDILDIENWFNKNKEALKELVSPEDILIKIWPILYAKSTNSSIIKLTPKESAQELALMWLQGLSYSELLNNLAESDTKIEAGRQLRNINQETVIDICQNTFSYGITLIISAISEMMKLEEDEDYEELIDDFNLLQKMIKYGLPNPLAITFYEIGFADRVIAIDLAVKFNHFSIYRSKLIDQIKEKKEDVLSVLNKYPSYFEKVLRVIVE